MSYLDLKVTEKNFLGKHNLIDVLKQYKEVSNF